MKKVIFTILFALLILIGSQNKVFAVSDTDNSCVSQNAGRCDDPTPTLCKVNGAPYCCATDQDCADFKNIQPCVPQAGGKCNDSQMKTYCLVNGSPLCCATAVDCQAAKSAANSAENVYCGSDQTGIQTAIGCLHILGSPEQFLGQILQWAVGIGGGIAFLLIIYAGFMIMTSAGNPERLKAGQELLTSAISGLILLVFSVFILKFIGVDILGLCKFGFGPSC